MLKEQALKQLESVSNDMDKLLERCTNSLRSVQISEYDNIIDTYDDVLNETESMLDNMLENERLEVVTAQRALINKRWAFSDAYAKLIKKSFTKRVC